MLAKANSLEFLLSPIYVCAASNGSIFISSVLSLCFYSFLTWTMATATPYYVRNGPLKKIWSNFWGKRAGKLFKSREAFRCYKINTVEPRHVSRPGVPSGCAGDYHRLWLVSSTRRWVFVFSQVRLRVLVWPPKETSPKLIGGLVSTWTYSNRGSEKGGRGSGDGGGRRGERERGWEREEGERGWGREEGRARKGVG